MSRLIAVPLTELSRAAAEMRSMVDALTQLRDEVSRHSDLPITALVGVGVPPAYRGFTESWLAELTTVGLAAESVADSVCRAATGYRVADNHGQSRLRAR